MVFNIKHMFGGEMVVFTLLDEKTQVEFFVKDGEKVKKGQTLAVVTGDIRVLLSGERTALNYLQRLSGRRLILFKWTME